MNAILVRRRALGPTGLVTIALIIVIAVSAVVVAIDGGRLVSTSNVVDIFTRMSLLGFVAVGQTLVILCRSLDLSVGYTIASTSLVTAIVMDGQGGRAPLALLAAIGVGAGIGLANGLVITKLRVNPFIATLGVGLIVKGYLDTEFQGPSGSTPPSFQRLGFDRIWVLPVSTLAMFVFAAIVYVVLQRTKVGHAIYAVGGDEEVARFSGLRTHRTLLTAHMLCGVAAALAGILLAARFGTGSALVYDDGYDLDSVAAVVLGGTALTGGRGSVAGTVAAVAILAVLDTVFNELQVNPFFKDVLRGVIVVVAVALYARRALARRTVRRRFGPGGAVAAPRPEEGAAVA